jgi:hypothetical protein
MALMFMIICLKIKKGWIISGISENNRERGGTRMTMLYMDRRGIIKASIIAEKRH